MKKGDILTIGTVEYFIRRKSESGEISKEVENYYIDKIEQLRKEYKAGAEDDFQPLLNKSFTKHLQDAHADKMEEGFDSISFSNFYSANEAFSRYVNEMSFEADGKTYTMTDVAGIDILAPIYHAYKVVYGESTLEGDVLDYLEKSGVVTDRVKNGDNAIDYGYIDEPGNEA